MQIALKARQIIVGGNLAAPILGGEDMQFFHESFKRLCTDRCQVPKEVSIFNTKWTSMPTSDNGPVRDTRSVPTTVTMQRGYS
jgi:hypothetical protein